MSVSEYNEFIDTIKSEVGKYGKIADKCLVNLRPSILWTAKHVATGEHEDVKILMNGCYGAAVEAVSLVSFGLIRPAILSLRSHYELSLMFLYYKNHPVEWRSTLSFRARPKLPGDVKKYLREHFENFSERWSNLEKSKRRKFENCYEILSGVAHGAAINSISSATKPADLVEKIEVVKQTPNIFTEVGETISDIYVSCFSGNWISLDDDVKSDLEKRLGAGQAAKKLSL